MKKRNKSESVKDRNKFLVFCIKRIKAEHPLWGYRRVWSYLKYREEFQVNKKRIYRLMKENELLVTKNLKLKAKRTSSRPKPKAKYPNHIWGIDMTKIKITTWGWLYFVVVLDWHTKEIVGYTLKMQSKSEDWYEALEKAVDKRYPGGIKDSMEKQLYLVSDNGCQPTSEKFMKGCSILGIKQIFTSWSNPKGNADTERVMRTLKEDLVWCYDWDNPFDFEKALKKWVDDYNRDFPHQSLKNMTPEQFYQRSINQELVLT